MDPFTISTGVGGFLSLAIELVKILTEYTTTAAGTSSDAQALLTEVGSLNQILHQLTNFLKKPENNVNFHETSVLCSVITICEAKIKYLHSRLDKFRSAGRASYWKWPFQKQDCLEIVRTLHHCAQTIELSLTISNGELLSRTSQQLTTALTDHKKQYDLTFEYLQIIPPALQQIRDDIGEVLHFVPTIDSLASDIQLVKNGVLQLQHQQKAARLNDIRKWLSPLEPHKRHHDIKTTRASNTGGWIFDTEVYKVWINQCTASRATPRERILPLYGMPGAGKTFIASMLIDHLFAKNTRNSKPAAIVYLYCDYRDQKNQNTTNIIGSITNQLLEFLTEDDLNTACDEIEAASKERQTNLDLNIRLMKLVLRMVDQIYICLDAIDELETETQSALIKLVQEILTTNTRSSGGILLCFTARPHINDMVTQILNDEPKSVTITANTNDIQSYILHQLDIDPHPKLMNDDLKRKLLTKIPMNSQGMFLLSALQIQGVFQEVTIAQRKAAIEKVPTDLYAAFRLSLDRLRTSSGPARDLGMKVLMWTHLARRQLHIEELLHALAVEDGATDLDKENIPLDETIVHCCNGLVVIDHEASCVRLVHYSLQEFFKLHGSEYFPDGHKEIARTCLTYLNFTPLLAHCSLAELVQLLRNYHLLEYAAAQWGHHARLQFDDALECLALRFLALEKPTSAVQYCFSSESVLDRISNTAYRAWVYQWDFEGTLDTIHVAGGVIHVAAAFGLETVVQFLLRPQGSEIAQKTLPRAGIIDINSRDRFGRTALYIAAANGYGEAVRILLEQPNVNINAGTPLAEAAGKGHKGVVRILLEHPNIDVNACEWHSVGALTYAAQEGHEGVIRILLEHPNIDVNAGEPLAMAARNGHEAIVRMLLEQPDVDFNTGAPLVEAAFNGHEGVVRILLEQPNIDVNARTPLGEAAFNGHEGVVRILLEHPDIDVNSWKWCALGRAAQEGHEGVIRILLEHPNIDIDINVGEPLARAARHGHEAIVRMLLEQPSIDVNAGTPLVEASWTGHERVVRMLLEHPNIDVNAGEPLGRAARNGHEGVVCNLLEHPNIDVNACKWYNFAALVKAAQAGHEGVVRMLLKHPNIDVNAGEPLAMAAQNGHEGIVRMLQEAVQVHALHKRNRQYICEGECGEDTAETPSGPASKKSKTH